MGQERLTREDWMRAARLALLKGGQANVRIEPLARRLKVSKGSFYWHFDSQPALLEALLQEWEAESELILSAIAAGGENGVGHLMDQVADNLLSSQAGETPSDAAIFAWASVDPRVAKRVQIVERQRIRLLTVLAHSKERAELAYLAYLGFVMRRRHAPHARAILRLLRNFMISALTPAKTLAGRDTIAMRPKV